MKIDRLKFPVLSLVLASLFLVISIWALEQIGITADQLHNNWSDDLLRLVWPILFCMCGLWVLLSANTELPLRNTFQVAAKIALMVTLPSVLLCAPLVVYTKFMLGVFALPVFAIILVPAYILLRRLSRKYCGNHVDQSSVKIALTGLTIAPSVMLFFAL